ncbi:MAG: glycosyltransferase [Chroococcidiopsidaceae cyanobacterium CP_BM_RX_35]|nr:glycosyltransferase [Chroococcidiopsidaceae cyanobacterium CP_BM_RX_35]
MKQKNPYQAALAPVSDDQQRPLWSVMIPTYNCANYLRETLMSVLAQDLGSEVMQIEVIDDHSTEDDPAAVVEEIGQGRVTFYRQPQNVGHTKNFQTCLERSRGTLIHLLHGDDCVLNGFYCKLQQAFAENSDIGAAFCRYIYMDEHGHWQLISLLEKPQSGVLDHWLEKIAVEQRIQTPSIVVRREIYETLGTFDSRLSWTEDWEMWVRITAHYPIWYEVEPLALYRMHANSSTGRRTRTGENIRDLRKAISLMKDYLPDDCADTLSESALRFYAFYALNDARRFVMQRDMHAALNQIREALLCCSSWSVVCVSLNLKATLLYLKVLDSLKRKNALNFES